MAGNSGQKGTICRRCVDDTVFDHENIGRGELRNIAEEIQKNRVLEAAIARLYQCTGIVGVEASGLGVQRRLRA